MRVLYIGRYTYLDGTLDGMPVPSERACPIEEVKERACAYSAIKYAMLRKEITEKQPSEEAKKVSIMLWDRLLARQGIVAYLPIIVAVILLIPGASWEYFLALAAVGYYACIALALAFPLKIYPILFLPAIFIVELQDAQRFYTPQQPLILAFLRRSLLNFGSSPVLTLTRNVGWHISNHTERPSHEKYSLINGQSTVCWTTETIKRNSVSFPGLVYPCASFHRR